MEENTNQSHDVWLRGTEMCRHASESISRSFLEKEASTTISLFFFVLFVGAFIFADWINVPSFAGNTLLIPILTPENIKLPAKKIEIPLSCTNGNTTQTCPNNYPATIEADDSSIKACPRYFRWIHEDLRPWKKVGITKEMVERGKGKANFRLVVIQGKVYVEKYKGAYQTRDVFTIWGILQLLRLYPGKLPDLDIIFECGDRPVILKSDYQGMNATSPPPMFHYCGDDLTMDIVFPDWSYWGWPEIKIKPWVTLNKELEEGNNRTKWMEREPYAYWKGNTRMGAARQDLFRCNPTDKHDWKAHIVEQNWNRETRHGFRNSNLANQCTHRYKIYIEGLAWSVSKKYILACDSGTLLVNPRYYDIFTRSLLPLKHYWPINENTKCKSIKFAVDWSNNHTQKAQKIGMAGSKFIQEKLKMSQVYDYMFHLLYGYAKLLKYQPSVPPNAVEVCSEKMACKAEGIEKMYKVESMVKGPATRSPCTMPPPYDPLALQSFVEKKEKLERQVEEWEVSGNIREEILDKV